jgi:hypothetical protein
MITSGAIQLATLPLMARYFNRVAPVGVLLNIGAGLLTGVLMLTAIGTIVAGGVSTWVAAQLGSVVNAAHYLLVHAVVPVANIPFATFRVAHYEGWHSIIYALYFVPLAMVGVLMDRWQPLDYVLPIDHLLPVDRTGKNRRAKEQKSESSLAASRRVRTAHLHVWLGASMRSACTVRFRDTAVRGGRLPDQTDPLGRAIFARRPGRFAGLQRVSG